MGRSLALLDKNNFFMNIGYSLIHFSKKIFLPNIGSSLGRVYKSNFIRFLLFRTLLWKKFSHNYKKFSHSYKKISSKLLKTKKIMKIKNKKRSIS